MTQFEQENDLGRGGGEVDDETMEKAEDDATERRSSAYIEDDPGPGAGPWAKTSSGDAENA